MFKMFGDVTAQLGKIENIMAEFKKQITDSVSQIAASHQMGARQHFKENSLGEEGTQEDDTPTEGTATAADMNTQERNHSRLPDHLKPTKMFKLDIPASVTSVILSDSVFRNIHGDMIDDGICVRSFGGAITDDLIDMFHRYEARDDIEIVVVHVGYNESKHLYDENIIEEKCQYLIQTCKEAFPKASLALSVVLPAKGGKNQHRKIQ